MVDPYEEDVFSSEVFTDENEDSIAGNEVSEAGTLTDLHNSSNIPEVEILSLLEEKIPLYNLRVNTTSRYSYEHSDWLRSARGSPEGAQESDEDDLDLSPVMMEETLKYFALCGERVVQMTKTYNDIDAVTKLLAEKEKDLELAAKIGQTLLEQNKKLSDRIDTLEEQLTVIDDQNTQLQHDLKLKSNLLKIYTDDPGYSDSDDDIPQDKKPGQFTQRVELLQKKVRTLEDENLKMRYDMVDLRETTDSMEEKEEQLMQDCLNQLGSSKTKVEVMTEELTKRLEENFRLQEEVTSLLAQLVDVQQKVKRMSIENEELTQDRQASKEAQRELTGELLELQEKYQECMDMLHEAQALSRQKRQESIPSIGGLGSMNVLNPLPVFPADSLAAELVDSVEQELGGDPQLTKLGKKNYNRSVMKTVKAVNKRSFNSFGPGYSEEFTSARVSPSSSVMSIPGTPYSELYEGDNDTDSMAGSVKGSTKVGIPGSNDLETALRRLELRKQNVEAERKYHAEHPTDSSEVGTPTCPTPDSFLSSLSGMSTGGFHGGYRSFMPEKLQIVKPMEGSLTLHHWQRLAQPHMASMLDQRPGVMVKGFREIDRSEMYSLDDIEDDGQVVAQTMPSKCHANTSSTYTFTNCNIGLLEPALSSTTRSSVMSPFQHQTSHPQRSAATRTFSTSLGIAQVLNERNTSDNVAVKTKSEITGGPVMKKYTEGLNLLTASQDNEKKAENPVPAPKGVHQVTGGIFSRNASPVSSQQGKIKIMDQATKQRLLEKVKNIRATRDQGVTKALQLLPSMAVMPATRNLGYSMATGIYSSPTHARPGASSGGITTFSSMTTPSMSVPSQASYSRGGGMTTMSSSSSRSMGLGDLNNLTGPSSTYRHMTTTSTSSGGNTATSSTPSGQGLNLFSGTSPMSVISGQSRGLSAIHKPGALL